MKRGLQLAALLLLTGLAAPAGEIVDRIMAVVNGAPILLSDWEEEVRFESLLNGRVPGAVRPEDRSAALDRLIDQALIRQQAGGAGFEPPSDEEMAARMAEIRSLLPAGASDTTWRAALERQGLAEDDVRDRVRVQLEVLRFVDQRFRPSVRLSFDEVERYYRERFLPELRRVGGEPKPLGEVRAQIERILIEQQVSAQLNLWLQALRSQARIEIHPPAERSGGSAEKTIELE